MDRMSYMVAVPSREEDLMEPETLMERIRNMEYLQIFKLELEEETIQLEAVYNETVYRAEIYPADFELPELFRVQHFFPDVDSEELGERESGLAVDLMFAGDGMASYHFQLKLVDALLPGVLAVVDISSEKILSGRWVGLAASSAVPPAPRYLYTVQAVSGKEGTVWLHTHGLNRCGSVELEILDSTVETYSTHYSIIEMMASRLIEKEEQPGPWEPMFLARLSEDALLVTTLLPWEDATEFYDEGILGGKSDRVDGHNEDTCCIFTYTSGEALEEKQVSPVMVFDGLLEENPVYMLSTRETERMKSLAMERLSYVKQLAGSDDCAILVKIGLTVDEDGDSDGSEMEHIWFELLELSDLAVKGKLTQEPYYISDLHEGDIGEYPADRITDWIIFTEKRRITPDDVYLLEL